MRSRTRLSFRKGLLFLAIITTVPGTAQQPTSGIEPKETVILGVLEDIPGKYADEPDSRVVRAVFRKIGDSWQAFSTKTKNYRDLETLPSYYPKEMTWTIAFDGKKLGTIASRTPSRFRFYSEIGIEQITSHGQIPTIGRKSPEYSSIHSSPVYRPLVAVSEPTFSDPARWKPTALSPRMVELARQQFRSRFPKASNCRNPEENIPRPWDYRDEDIHIKAYSSNNGWSLVGLNLIGNACDGKQGSQNEYDIHWYVIDPSGTARFLGADMWLVDAGDYDNDGNSEVLFSLNEYNLGGYRLFYRDFTKSAEFIFHYH